MSHVTSILSRIEAGDPQAAEQLLPLVYDELRKLAAAKLAQETPGQTLQPTALVHDAYLRLVTGPGGSEELQAAPLWDNRGHFFAAAAEAMRRILIENARHRSRGKHGGGLKRVDLFDAEIAAVPPDEELLLLDDALTRLADVRPQAAEVVKLRFFTGLSVEEAARMIGVSTRSAGRLWVFAQAWLRREMESTGDDSSLPSD